MNYETEGTEIERATGLVNEFLSKTFQGGFLVKVDRYPFKLRVAIKINQNYIAGFTLVEQTNCCGILVSTQTFVIPEYALQGIAQQMMPLKEALAREFGYTMLLATVNVSGNPAEVHILEKFRWTRGTEFVNKRTGNTVAIFTKILT